MNGGKMLGSEFDEPLIWIYDPRYAMATESDLAKNALADFDRPMMPVDKAELAALVESGHKIEFV